MVNENKEIYWKEFESKLRIARNLLVAVKIKEIRDLTRSVRPFAKFRDEMGPVRRMMKNFMDEVYNLSLPLILVFCVSSLESFLRYMWLNKVGSIDKDTWRIFSNPKEFAKIIKRRFKVEIGDVTFKANAVAMKRHLILHKDKIVDSKALRAFREAGMLDIDIGQKLKLTSKIVEKDISIIQEFAEKVKEIFENEISPR